MVDLTNNEFPLVCIVAMSKNNVIGDGNKLPWHLPEDLKRLKIITMGNPLIMGRKTFMSIGKPLLGRANIVLTRKTNWYHEGIIIAYNFKESIERANMWINKNFNEIQKKEKSIFIFGGGEIYNCAINYCNRIELTLVETYIEKGIKFPKIENRIWKKKFLDKKECKKTSLSYSYWTYNRLV